MKAKIRIIGDVHQIIGNRGVGRNYLNLIAKAEYSLQVGDFSFDYRWLERVDPEQHRIILGNHENYPRAKDYPHFLGDFGVHSFPLKEGEFSFFYIRGARSVDKWARKEHIDWFAEEELNYTESHMALEMYTAMKPDIMISHECPAELMPFFLRNDWGLGASNTAKLLQACYEAHKPKTWLFGHLHHSRDMLYEGVGITPRGQQIDNGPRTPTRFICLNELDFVDVDETGVIGHIQ